jgi:prephenate dehydratase
MLKIESRPDKRSLGRYVFLIDMEGHRDDPVVKDALDGVQARAAMFKILGSYPRARTET